jgi:thiamine-monophosphate kinase
MFIKEIGEFGLIDRLAQKLGQPDESVIVGIGDDAAVLQVTEGHQTVMTTDMLVEGIHFLSQTITFHNLGFKSLAVSISDIAAMGGIPKHAVISLAIPPQVHVESLESLYEGVAEICRQHGTHVVGGDIVKIQERLVISVTILGEVETGRALLRSGAKPGDVVFVSGTVGGSAAGLALLQGEGDHLSVTERDKLIEFHQRPKPQVLLGRLLLQSGICTSCNDISDGLASELNEIAQASGVGMEIERSAIPIHSAVRAFASAVQKDPLDFALFGGEDYQLVGTAREDAFPSLQMRAREMGISLTRIGIVTKEKGIWLTGGGQQPRLIEAKGYCHF